VADQHRRSARAERLDGAGDVGDHVLHGIGLDRMGFVGAAVAANVDGRRGEAGGGDGAELMAPGKPRLWKAVDHQHQRAGSLDGDTQRQLAHRDRAEIGHGQSLVLGV